MQQRPFIVTSLSYALCAPLFTPCTRLKDHFNPFPVPGHASEPSIGRRGTPAAAQAAPEGPW